MKMGRQRPLSLTLILFGRLGSFARLTASFKRSVKKLKRRYPHIQDDIREGVELLLQTPRLGVVVSGSGGIRKVRLPNRDAKRGKSGGYRLLYYLEDNEFQLLYLLFYITSLIAQM